MPITDLANPVTGVGATTAVTVGASTPAPYGGATVTGFVDGTSPTNASKNMALLYNRNEFSKQWIIEQAGLVFDPNNWAQMGQAIAVMIANTNNYAALGTALAPTAAPTAANPATRVVNNNDEVFDWNGSGWFLSGNGLKLSANSAGGAVGTTMTMVASVIAPRNGTISASIVAAAQNVAATDVMFASVSVDNATFIDYTNQHGRAGATQWTYLNASTAYLDVVAGQQIGASVVFGSGTYTVSGGVKIKYLD